MIDVEEKRHGGVINITQYFELEKEAVESVAPQARVERKNLRCFCASLKSEATHLAENLSSKLSVKIMCFSRHPFFLLLFCISSPALMMELLGKPCRRHMFIKLSSVSKEIVGAQWLS